MLPASRAPFPWLIVFSGEIESEFISLCGGCEGILLRQVGSLTESWQCHILRLVPDIVGGPKKTKWRLKYVMFTQY